MKQLNTEQAIEHIQQLAQSQSLDAEILVNESQTFSVSFKSQKIDKYELSNKKRLGIRAVIDGREGMSYTESFAPEDLLTCLKGAAENAKVLTQDYEAKLIAPEPTKEMPELYNESLEEISIEQKLDMAKKLESTTLAIDSRIKALPYNTVSHFRSKEYVANTNGVNQSFQNNGIYAYAYCLAQDGEERAMAGEAQISRDAKELDVQAIAKKAAHKTLSRLGDKPPKTGNYPVVLSNEAAQTFFGQIEFYFSAKAVDENLSLLKDQLHKKCFSEQLSITDHPFYTGAFNSSPFDSEGAASKITPLVENGQLLNFLTNSIYANKLGVENTGNASRSPSSALKIAPTNFVVKPGSQSIDQLLSVYPKTILITNLKGLAGFDAISGDISVESEGFLYENGEPVAPISNFVVSGNVMDILKQVESVGNDPYVFYSSVITPSLLIPELSIAGQ